MLISPCTVGYNSALLHRTSTKSSHHHSSTTRVQVSLSCKIYCIPNTRRLRSRRRTVWWPLSIHPDLSSRHGTRTCVLQSRCPSAFPKIHWCSCRVRWSHCHLDTLWDARWCRCGREAMSRRVLLSVYVGWNVANGRRRKQTQVLSHWGNRLKRSI